MSPAPVLTRRALRREAADRLAAAGVAVPHDEARWLLECVSGLEGSELAAGDAEPASSRERRRLGELLDRRLAGEPIQHVLASWSFRGHDLFVDPRVLIPRPETEQVVESALVALSDSGVERGRRDPWRGTDTAYDVADLGTGSGAVAIALAAELPGAAVWATDVDGEALAVARANVAGAGSVATRIRLLFGSWFDALPAELRGRVRLIVTNPPYVAEAEWPHLPAEVRDHEPRSALVAGPSGLEAIAAIVADAPVWLGPDGLLVVEIGETQAGAARALAIDAGFVDVVVHLDLAGRDRVLVARRPRA